MFVLEIKDAKGQWHKIKGSTIREELDAEVCGEGETVRIREITFDYEQDPDNFIDKGVR